MSIVYAHVAVVCIYGGYRIKTFTLSGSVLFEYSSKNMNILFVTPYFPPQTGGVVSYVDSIQRLLRQRGHQVHVLLQGDAHDVQPTATTTDASAYEIYFRLPRVPGARFAGFVAFWIYFIPTLLRLHRFLKEKRVDIVVLEYPLPYMFYFHLLKLMSGIKLIVGLHGSDVLSLGDFPKHEQWLVKRTIGCADWLLAHSSSLMSQTDEIVGPINSKKSYIPYGVETARLRALARQETGSLSLPDRPFVLTVAKLHSRKGLDVLLRAIEKLGSFVMDLRFVIVGDGPEESALKQAASKLGILDRVIFTGALQLPAICKLYQHCEFFVLPSRSEPFGIVLLEAMTFGKALVATKVGGIPEFVTDGYNGLLLDSDDSDVLAERIRRLLEDDNLRRHIGLNGLRWVEERYDYSVVIANYEMLLQRIYSQPSYSAKPILTHRL